MPFILIKGNFAPDLGVPDGDSCRFIPDNPNSVYKLKQNGKAPKFNKNNHSINLRYEGIDTLEKNAIKPYSSDTTDYNLSLLGITSETRMTKGSILTTQLDPNGRIISFVFNHSFDSEKDGSLIHIDEKIIKQSANYKLIDSGYAYPLFYDSLFHDIREILAQAYLSAKNKGIMSYDKTNQGVEWDGSKSLEKLPPIFPKLWRRLDNYTKIKEFKHDSENLERFIEYLNDVNDRVLIKSNVHKTCFANIVEISGNNIKLNKTPDELIFDK